jgi:hypothetical protein
MSETKTYSGSCGCGEVRFAFGKYSADGQEKVIVNLRCVEGLDVDALEVERFDGKRY